jgi:periplasmic divalent cation tolerance protein
MEYIAVVTTIGTLAEAQAIARTLLESKLAACAQISEIESFYHWNDALQNEKEFRVLLKTTSERYPAIELAIKALHSYELPAIHAFALAHVYAPYAAWIDNNITDEQEK